jgi:glutamyl-tRNA reductase
MNRIFNFGAGPAMLPLPVLEKAKEEFLDWTKEMQVSPVIHQMKNALEQIRIEEMGRFLKKVEVAGVQAEWADELTKNLMQRIIKNHVVQLKASCRRGDSEQLVGVLSQIFNIESSSEA